MKQSEKGVTLVETLVALAILGLVAVVFLVSMTMIARATLLCREQATAESIAKSQIEYIKSQSYIDYATPAHGEYAVITVPVGYSLQKTAAPISPTSGQPLPEGSDQNIQKILVSVYHNDDLVLTVVDYKVNR